MRSATRFILAIVLTGVASRGSQLPVKVYTTADGLPHNDVLKIVRDSRGYLWFCTAEGLSRFDGYSFTNYGPKDGLPHRSITDLLETRSGEYWVATGDGLARFDPAAPGRKFRVFLPGADVWTRSITALAEDRAGSLWVGTQHGLYRLDRTRNGDSRIASEWSFQQVDIGMPSGEDAVNALLEDHRGTLWIGANSGLYRRLPTGTAQRFSKADGLPADEITAILEDHSGRIWVGTNAGLCRVSSNPEAGRIVEHIYTAADGLANEPVFSLLETSTGKLLVGAANGLSELLPEPLENSRAFKTYTMADGLNSLEILTVAEDRDHNLWCGGNGAIEIPRTDFSAFTGADGLTAQTKGSSSVRTTSIFQDRYGAVHVTAAIFTTPADRRVPFISRWNGERFTSVYPNLPHWINSIGWGTQQVALQDRAGDWWFATKEGLCRFACPPRFEQLAHSRPKGFYTTADGLYANEVLRIFEDSRSDLWIATVPNGLTRWNRRADSFERFTGDGGGPLFGEIITAFGEDRGGDVWIGQWSGGLARFRDGKFARFGETEGLGAGGVRQIFRDHSGRLWIATRRGGVTRVDSPESDQPRFKRVGMDQGLSSDQIECITEDRWGRIYAGGGRGIDRLDPTAPDGVGRTKHFTTADGLAGGALQAAFADREGNLWFGTSLGVSRLVPELDPPQPPPPVLISGLTVHGVPYQALSDLGIPDVTGIQLKPAQAQIQVSFLAISFEAGKVLRYQFMLAGADPDWGPATEQRTVTYANLAPGSYRFLVRAINIAGISKPASVAFTVLPHFWQRWWFLASCICAAASIAYGFHISRVSQLLRLERVRTRIATDLHDDIGASLSQIAVVSEALSRGDAAEGRFREPLSQMATDSRELVASMSDLVWSIDPRRDHLQDLIQRMRRFASDMFTASNIQFRFSTPASDLHLSPDQRRQMFLIFKEGVNNIVRHSGCTEAEISLVAEGNSLSLKVSDNGRGLDLSQAGHGNGLNDMQARAQELGGTLEITGGRHGGTDITVKVPLGRLAKPRWNTFFHPNRS